MRWFKHGFTHSLYNLFAQSSPTVRSQATDCTQEIRDTMLLMLGERIHQPALAPLVRRLRLASGAQELWYLREGLMSALAQHEGESTARLRMARLDALFKGQVPASMIQPRVRALG